MKRIKNQAEIEYIGNLQLFCDDDILCTSQTINIMFCSVLHLSDRKKPILDSSKLKEFADAIFKFDKNGGKFS